LPADIPVFLTFFQGKFAQKSHFFMG